MFACGTDYDTLSQYDSLNQPKSHRLTGRNDQSHGILACHYLQHESTKLAREILVPAFQSSPISKEFSHTSPQDESEPGPVTEGVTEAFLTIEKYNDMLYDEQTPVNKVLKGVSGAFDTLGAILYVGDDEESHPKHHKKKKSESRNATNCKEHREENSKSLPPRRQTESPPRRRKSSRRDPCLVSPAKGISSKRDRIHNTDGPIRQPKHHKVDHETQFVHSPSNFVKRNLRKVGASVKTREGIIQDHQSAPFTELTPLDWCFQAVAPSTPLQAPVAYHDHQFRTHHSDHLKSEKGNRKKRHSTSTSKQKNTKNGLALVQQQQVQRADHTQSNSMSIRQKNTEESSASSGLRQQLQKPDDIRREEVRLRELLIKIDRFRQIRSQREVEKKVSHTSRKRESFIDNNKSERRLPDLLSSVPHTSASTSSDPDLEALERKFENMMQGELYSKTLPGGTIRPPANERNEQNEKNGSSLSKRRKLERKGASLVPPSPVSKRLFTSPRQNQRAPLNGRRPPSKVDSHQMRWQESGRKIRPSPEKLASKKRNGPQGDRLEKVGEAKIVDRLERVSEAEIVDPSLRESAAAPHHRGMKTMVGSPKATRHVKSPSEVGDLLENTALVKMRAQKSISAYAMESHGDAISQVAVCRSSAREKDDSREGLDHELRGTSDEVRSQPQYVFWSDSLFIPA
jgi:hypothetical protein